MRLVKIKEHQQFKFFASNAIDVYANKFQSTDKVIFICANWRRPSFLLFCQGIRSVLIFLTLTDREIKESKKLKN